MLHPAVVVAIPRYIPDRSARCITTSWLLTASLISFGMDFAEKLLSHHSSLFVAIPYLLLVAAAVGLQYLQMSRLNARNPQAAQANPQAAMLQKYMPLIFGFIYLNVAAILNVYFIVSSAIRILTQEILFRKGLVAGPGPAPAAGSGAKKGPAADRSERALPKPKTGRRQRDRNRQGHRHQRNRWAAKAGRRPAPGPRARPRRAPRASRPDRRERRPTGRTDEQEGGVEQRQRLDRTSKAEQRHRVGQGQHPGERIQRDRIGRGRRRCARCPRSIPGPRPSVRERPGRKWSGWKPAENRSSRPRRSSSICWVWPRTTPSSSCSASPRQGCSVACAGRPGCRPG